MAKEKKYTTIIVVLAVLLVISLFYTVNTKITGQTIKDYQPTVWLKSWQEIDSDIYIDGEFYKHVKQLGVERIKLDPGTHTIKVTSEIGGYEETLTLEEKDSTTMYVKYPLEAFE